MVHEPVGSRLWSHVWVVVCCGVRGACMAAAGPSPQLCVIRGALQLQSCPGTPSQGTRSRSSPFSSQAAVKACLLCFEVRASRACLAACCSLTAHKRCP